MPRAEFFARFQLFVDKNFLEPEVCARVLSEARQAARASAIVGKGGSGYELDATIRNTKQLQVAGSTVSLVTGMLLISGEIDRALWSGACVLSTHVECHTRQGESIFAA